MDASSPDVTTLLVRARSGDPEERRAAADELFRLVQPRLHSLAEQYLARAWQADPLLQPTLLLDEAFSRLVLARQVRPENRGQFFGFAARVMRQVLVEYARARRARGSGVSHYRIDGSLDLPAAEAPLDLVELDEALNRLEQLDRRASRVVELRFFGGLTWEEIAEEMGVAPATVKRDW